MIEYRPKQPMSPAAETVVVAGREIGEIWPSRNGYQCQIKFGPLTIDYRGLSLNGIAETKDAAIMDAIKEGREKAQALCEACDWLDSQFFQPLSEAVEEVS